MQSVQSVPKAQYEGSSHSPLFAHPHESSNTVLAVAAHVPQSEQSVPTGQSPHPAPKPSSAQLGSAGSAGSDRRVQTSGRSACSSDVSEGAQSAGRGDVRQQYAPARGKVVADVVLCPYARVCFGRGRDGRRCFCRRLSWCSFRHSGGTAARREAVDMLVKWRLHLVRAVLLGEPCFVARARCVLVKYRDMRLSHGELELAARHHHVR